jgi:hypothetical protein
MNAEELPGWGVSLIIDLNATLRSCVNNNLPGISANRGESASCENRTNPLSPSLLTIHSHFDHIRGD